MFDVGRNMLASVARMPDAPAIADGDVVRTYASWLDDMLHIVGGLDVLGLI